LVGIVASLAGLLILLCLGVWLLSSGRRRSRAATGGATASAAMAPIPGPATPLVVPIGPVRVIGAEVEGGGESRTAGGSETAGESRTAGDSESAGESRALSEPASTPSVDDANDQGETPDKGDESAYDLLQRGHALLRGRHNAQAAVVLERAARVEPGKGSILEALGRAYFNSGQHARAAETFEALLEIDPSAPYGHFGLGLSFARLGRPTEARTHLRMAAALDPSSDTYRKALHKVESASA